MKGVVLAKWCLASRAHPITADSGWTNGMIEGVCTGSGDYPGRKMNDPVLLGNGLLP